MSHPITVPNSLRLPNLAASDRLMIAIVLAILIHAAVIFGLRFDLGSAKPKRVSRTLDVTLIAQPSLEAPKKADVLAQENQIAQGTADKKAIAKAVPQPARIRPPKPPRPAQVRPRNRVSPSPAAPAHKPKPSRKAPRPIVTTPKSNAVAPTAPVKRQPSRSPAQERPALSAETLAQQIAEVGAEYSRASEQYAKREKIVFINSVNAHKYMAAAYERAWQDKVERIGNLNFPEEARRKKLSGNLLLSVGIRKDGSVYSIEVRRSSGHKVLDEAARRIVRLAAPFAPFPEGLRKEADVLVITRTWKFFNDSYRLSRK